MERASASARIKKKDTAVLRRLYSLFVSHLPHKMPTFVQSVGSVWCVRICCEAINGSPFTSAVDWRVNQSTVSQQSTNKSGHAHDVSVDSKHAFIEIIVRELSTEPQRNLLGCMDRTAWMGYGNCVTAT
jgi:hypothetical protein